jgi:serine/threonine-protein kinase
MKKKHLGIFVALIILVVAGYFSFNMIMNALIHSDKEVIVPDITGKKMGEAFDILSASGLAIIKETDELNYDFAPGTVIRQSPPPDMTVREGKIVKITVSKNVEEYLTPDLSNVFVRRADMILKSVHMMLGEITTRPSVLGEKGVVIEQSPAAGSPAEKGMIINIVVSEGPPPQGIRLMPNFVKRTLVRAQEWAKRENIELKIVEQATKGTPGTITAQDPAPDTDITDATSVRLTVIAK